MDTIGGRIRSIRKDNGLTLVSFSERIGISNQSLSAIETGKNNPSNQTILMICREFGVDEVWLRTGVGEPFRQESREEQIMRFAAQTIKGSDEFRKAFVSTLAKMDADDWITLGKLFDNLANEMKKNE